MARYKIQRETVLPRGVFMPSVSYRYAVISESTGARISAHKSRDLAEKKIAKLRAQEATSAQGVDERHFAASLTLPPTVFVGGFDNATVATGKVDAQPTPKQVRALLVRHAAGDLDAGDRAYEIAARLARKLTALTFDDMVESAKTNNYHPTLRVAEGPDWETLADVFDYACARRGILVVAHRGKVRQ